MPKYLWRGSYSAEGLKGLIHDGGTKRRDSVRRLAESLGGSLESCYFGFGTDDIFLIYDMPDNVSAAAGALVVGATGAVHGQTIALLTPEEVDQATRKTADYQPPGAS
jgi:uncharacterized protein with GYD domain